MLAMPGDTPVCCCRPERTRFALARLLCVSSVDLRGDEYGDDLTVSRIGEMRPRTSSRLRSMQTP
jgi:hypothetical protein